MMTTKKRAPIAKTRVILRARKRAAPVAAPRRAAGNSKILAAVHETIADLHAVGVVSVETMREFDEQCLEPVQKLSGAEIAALRRQARVSQPVFAKYLNVSKSSVSQWETGAKSPDGPALKLLSLVKRKGLAAIA